MNIRILPYKLILIKKPLKWIINIKFHLKLLMNIRILSDKLMLNKIITLKMDNKHLITASAKNVILRIFAYELLFNKIYPDLHQCCNLPHRTFEFSSSLKLKCRNCAKYVIGKKFTHHLEKCIKRDR